MLPGPIFNVELLTAARRKRYFWIRAVYASILLFVVWFLYLKYALGSERIVQRVANISIDFLHIYSLLQLTLILLLAPAMVAGTIATERERRTIEHLFASTLTNGEIVLGKLAAKLVHILTLVLAGVPILALMMLLGGIAPEAILAMTIIAFCTLMSVCGLSIAASAWSAKARTAISWAYLVLTAFLIIPPLIDEWVRSTSFFFSNYAKPFNNFLLAINPYNAMFECIDKISGPRASWAAAIDILIQFAVAHLAIAAILIAAATLTVRRTHLAYNAKTTQAKPTRIGQWIRPPLGNRPMFWKEVFAEPVVSHLGWFGRVTTAIIVLGVILPTFYVFFSYYGYTHRSAEEYLRFTVGMGPLLSCAGLLFIAAKAAGCVTAEKERDTWASLIGTPLEPREIVWSKILGSIWSIRWLMLVLLLVWGLACFRDPGFLAAMPFTIGVFVILAFYVASLGVRVSLQCRSSLHAMGLTISIAAFLGGLYLFLCIPLLFAFGSNSSKFINLIFSPCIPYLLAIPCYFYIQVTSGYLYARNELAMIGLQLFFGISGYLILTIFLISNSICRFDKITGRVARRP